MITIKLPPMIESENILFKTLIEVEKLHNKPNDWSLIGGQMVSLFAIERNVKMNRKTNDLDVVLNIRANARVLYNFTNTLYKIGFKSKGASPEGFEHRWIKDDIKFDILIPDVSGERIAVNNRSITGGKTISTPGAQFV